MLNPYWAYFESTSLGTGEEQFELTERISIIPPAGPNFWPSMRVKENGRQISGKKQGM